MENFVNPASNRPITDIRIKVGETQVVGLKLPHISYDPYLAMLPLGDDVLRNIDVFCETTMWHSAGRFSNSLTRNPSTKTTTT